MAKLEPHSGAEDPAQAAPEPWRPPSPRPAQDGRPRGRAAPPLAAARRRRALLMSKYGPGRPAPPTPARDSRRAAAALPRRHLGPCHVSRDAAGFRGRGRRELLPPLPPGRGLPTQKRRRLEDTQTGVTRPGRS